ncbi:YdgA family protein [Tumebacillus flagellatus]|nr:YdgA family protein [Tumebacillus flagellatus]
MKKSFLIGLVIIALAVVVGGSTTITNNASVIPDDPMGKASLKH